MFATYLTSFALCSTVLGHYTWPQTTYGGTTDAQFQHIRMTDNHYSQDPVTNMTDPNLRCYNSQWLQTASTLTVTAGSTITLVTDGTLYHPGVVNVYMAQAPASADITSWDPTTAVWFKTYQISATVNSTGWYFPSQNWPSVPNIPIPAALPSGNYLLRIEQIGLHVASTFGGAQFYIGCVQLTVTGGGNGTPSPLVAFPGAYTGNEPGILVNIYGPPYPSSYTQPGPPVWTGGSGGSQTTTVHTTTTTKATTTTTTTSTTIHPTTTTTTTTTTGGGGGACAALYGQCGGLGFTGPTCCASGTCKVSSVYYSQCLT